MPFPHLFLLVGAVILVLMVLLWLLSLQIKNASIIDIFWGIGFVMIAWIAFALTPQGYLPRKLLLGVLVTIWGLRLAIHIRIRNLGKPEDFRYAKWREENGARWWGFSFVTYKQRAPIPALFEFLNVFKRKGFVLFWVDLYDDPAILREPADIVIDQLQRLDPHVLILRRRDVNVFERSIRWRRKIGKGICATDV